MSDYPPITEMPLDEKFRLHELTYRLRDFTDLPKRFQERILEAEANRQREIEERYDPSAPHAPAAVQTQRFGKREGPALGCTSAEPVKA